MWVISGHLREPHLHLCHSQAQGKTAVRGAVMGRRGEGRELMAVDRKMGYLLV